MESLIWLVVRREVCLDCGMDEPVRAFASEVEAVAFRDALNAYVAAAPVRADQRTLDDKAWRAYHDGLKVLLSRVPSLGDGIGVGV